MYLKSCTETVDQGRQFQKCRVREYVLEKLYESFFIYQGSFIITNMACTVSMINVQ